MKYEFIAPCHFGLESVLKREVSDLGLEIVKVEDGKVTFSGDVTGAVVLMRKENSSIISELQKSLANAGAQFLGRQLEG